MDVQGCLETCWNTTNNWKDAAEHLYMEKEQCIRNCCRVFCINALSKYTVQAICISAGLAATLKTVNSVILWRKNIAENMQNNIDPTTRKEYVKRGQQELDAAWHYSTIAVGCFIGSIITSQIVV